MQPRVLSRASTVVRRFELTAAAEAYLRSRTEVQPSGSSYYATLAGGVVVEYDMGMAKHPYLGPSPRRSLEFSRPATGTGSPM